MSAWRADDTASEHWVASSTEPGLRLFLRAHGDNPARPPVLFVHGATHGSRLYDIPHPGASWLAATAAAGFAAYGIDLRGYGRSVWPGLETARGPIARASEVIHDIDDAMRWIAARHGVQQVALVGGSWGSVTTAIYAGAQGQGRVARLVLYAPIYAERNDTWIAELQDPTAPGTLNPALGPFRRVTAAQTGARWDAELPPGADWRDVSVFDRLMAATLADEPDGGASGSFRAPNGTLVDLWDCFNGRPLSTPAAISCPTLLIRGGADTTSTRSDALALLDRLGTPNRGYVEIAAGSHFLTAERSAPQVFALVNAFLGYID